MLDHSGGGVIDGLALLAAAEFQALSPPPWVGPGIGICAAVAAGGVIWLKVSSARSEARTAAAQEADRLHQLEDFHPRLHPTLDVLTDPFRARRLWTEDLKIGAASKGRIDTSPQLVPHPGDENTKADSGYWKTLTGARLRLTIPPGCSPETFTRKAKEIASALNVTHVAVVGSDGSTITLDLRVTAAPARAFDDFHPRLRPALARLTDDWQAGLLWVPLKLGRESQNGYLGTWPMPVAEDIDPHAGVWKELQTGDARIRLQIPEGWSPQDVVDKADAIASALDVWGVRVIEADGNQVCLELRAEALKPDAAFLANYPEALHTALSRVRDSWDASRMWTELKMGRRPSAIEPGAWPTLTTRDAAPEGIESNNVGVRLHLKLPDNVSRRDFEDDKKSDNLASALDVPAVHLVEARGNIATVELRVFDPIAEVAMSPLITTTKTLGPDGKPGIRYRLAMPIDSLSCHDDFRIGKSEYGDVMTVNFADSVHRAVQGATRSGKSITFNTLIVYSLIMRDTVTVIIDPNGATVAPFWQCADYVSDADTPEEVIKTLEIVLKEMYQRKRLFSALRASSITEFSPELPLWNIFIDENSHYAESQDYKRELQKLAKQIAKFGGRLNIADQKMDVQALPSAVTVNLFDRVCHRVATRAHFDHLLPGLPNLARMAADQENPMAAGVAIARLMGNDRPVRMRVDYMPAVACYDLGDEITAFRGGPKRPPMDVDGDDTETGNITDLNSRRPVAVDLDGPSKPAICEGPNCTVALDQSPTGRTKHYHSEACRKAAERARAKTKKAFGH